mmetsp:Transcript_2661/g.4747  ORF Transcript_2661/g.4747 Transcript_2661/m.4747 type:complete len:294 (-) Transcript_2661:390-1271(-)
MGTLVSQQQFWNMLTFAHTLVVIATRMHVMPQPVLRAPRVALPLLRGLAEAPPCHDDVSRNQRVSFVPHDKVGMQRPLHLPSRRPVVPLQNPLVGVRNVRHRVGVVPALHTLVHPSLPRARVHSCVPCGPQRLHKGTSHHIELGQSKPLAENPIQGLLEGRRETLPHTLEKGGGREHRELGHELHLHWATEQRRVGFGPRGFHPIPVEQVRPVWGGKQDPRLRHGVVEDGVAIELQDVICPRSVVVSPQVHQLPGILPEAEKPIGRPLGAKLSGGPKRMDLQPTHVLGQQILQ